MYFSSPFERGLVCLLFSTLSQCVFATKRRVHYDWTEGDTLGSFVAVFGFTIWLIVGVPCVRHWRCSLYDAFCSRNALDGCHVTTYEYILRQRGYKRLRKKLKGDNRTLAQRVFFRDLFIDSKIIWHNAFVKDVLTLVCNTHPFFSLFYSHHPLHPMHDFDGRRLAVASVSVKKHSDKKRKRKSKKLKSKFSESKPKFKSESLQSIRLPLLQSVDTDTANTNADRSGGKFFTQNPDYSVPVFPVKVDSGTPVINFRESVKHESSFDESRATATESPFAQIFTDAAMVTEYDVYDASRAPCLAYVRCNAFAFKQWLIFVVCLVLTLILGLCVYFYLIHFHIGNDWYYFVVSQLYSVVFGVLIAFIHSSLKCCAECKCVHSQHKWIRCMCHVCGNLGICAVALFAAFLFFIFIVIAVFASRYYKVSSFWVQFSWAFFSGLCLDWFVFEPLRAVIAVAHEYHLVRRYERRKAATGVKSPMPASHSSLKLKYSSVQSQSDSSSKPPSLRSLSAVDLVVNFSENLEDEDIATEHGKHGKAKETVQQKEKEIESEDESHQSKDGDSVESDGKENIPPTADSSVAVDCVAVKNTSVESEVVTETETGTEVKESDKSEMEIEKDATASEWQSPQSTDTLLSATVVCDEENAEKWMSLASFGVDSGGEMESAEHSRGLVYCCLSAVSRMCTGVLCFGVRHVLESVCCCLVPAAVYCCGDCFTCCFGLEKRKLDQDRYGVNFREYLLWKHGLSSPFRRPLDLKKYGVKRGIKRYHVLSEAEVS